MEIQALQQAELQLLTHLTPEGWPTVIPPFQNYLQADHCFPLKGSVDNQIVAAGALIVHKDVAWLAHIVVQKKYRNRGFGKQITKGLMDLALKKACKTIHLIATDLGAIIYNQLGFETTCEYSFFKDFTAKGANVPSKEIHPFQKEWKTQLLDMDHQISGEQRKSTLSPHLQDALIIKDGANIEACYYPTLGDGLILSTNPTAGLSLLNLHLEQHSKVCFPANNQLAIQFMEKNQCFAHQKAKRMIWGEKKKVKYSFIYNRIGGNLG